MELGMIALKKIGANMANRLVKGGHRVVGFDLNQKAVAELIESTLDDNPTMDGIAPFAPDSGEG